MNRKTKWEKNIKVLRDKNGKKYLESTEITKDYKGVIKEDMLNGMAYENVSQFQQMLYHAYKKIESLELKILKLEKSNKKEVM